MTGLAASFVWAGGVGHLVLEAPAGSHINEAAPASLTVNGAAVNGHGDLSGWRVPVADSPAPRGRGPGASASVGEERPHPRASVRVLSAGSGATAQFPPETQTREPALKALTSWRLQNWLPGAVTVEAEVPICTDDGSLCTVFRVSGSSPASRKGSLTLSPRASSAAQVSEGAAVLVYDFSAVWCPPCNLMAAEVLDTPEGLVALSGRTLTKVDADAEGSWALKSRYHVGGYPTMIAVDAAGAEVSRLLGYPGREPTIAWLGSLSSVQPLSARMQAAGPAAGRLARELAESGDESGARAMLAKASDAPVDSAIARLLLDGEASDARWLFDQGVPGGDWVYAALDADPTLATRVSELVPGAPGEAAAGWLHAAADQTKDPDLSRALLAGALAALEASRTGDLELDRGRLTELADLRAALGDWRSAFALLDEAAARWPNEFTWPFVKARIGLDAGELGIAEAEAMRALANAQGDQILRAGMTLARVLRGLERGPEAIAVLDRVLLQVPEPPAGIEVRTTRYRKEVVTLRGEGGGPPISY